MQKKGYTMIELLIILSVSGLLILLGTSSYRKAQERQTMKADQESILELLQKAQKQAVIGQKDCSGSLLGIEISFSAGSQNITKTAICQSGSGSPEVKRMEITSASSSLTFRYRPLDGSTNIEPPGTSLNLTTPLGVVSTLNISTTGSLSYATN